MLVQGMKIGSHENKAIYTISVSQVWTVWRNVCFVSVFLCLIPFLVQNVVVITISFCLSLPRVIKFSEKYISKILKYSPICDICLAWYSVWLKDEAFKVLLVLEYFIKNVYSGFPEILGKNVFLDLHVCILFCIQNILIIVFIFDFVFLIKLYCFIFTERWFTCMHIQYYEFTTCILFSIGYLVHQLIS